MNNNNTHLEVPLAFKLHFYPLFNMNNTNPEAPLAFKVLILFITLFNNNNNNVHLSCAHQRPERSHDTY